MEPRLVDLSKAMSWLLRHGAKQAGIEMQSDGSVSINEMLGLRQFKRFTRQDILEVVEKNEKKRFSTQGAKLSSQFPWQLYLCQMCSLDQKNVVA